MENTLRRNYSIDQKDLNAENNNSNSDGMTLLELIDKFDNIYKYFGIIFVFIGDLINLLFLNLVFSYSLLLLKYVDKY